MRYIAWLLFALLSVELSFPQQKIIELNTVLMNSTLRIHGQKAGEKDSISFGTVFMMGKEVPKDKALLYYVVVTAAHVFDNIAGDYATLTVRKKNADDSYRTYPWNLAIRKNGEPLYYKHPSADVAAIYADMPNDLDVVVLPTGVLATDETLKKYEIHPGDEMMCLGFPNFVSTQFGFPILRSGKIASYPITPAKLVSTILHDATVFPGNSGGPVYFVDTNRFYGSQTHLGEVIQFVIGLQTSQVLMKQTGESLVLGAIVPASFIIETINMLPAESPYK